MPPVAAAIVAAIGLTGTIATVTAIAIEVALTVAASVALGAVSKAIIGKPKTGSAITSFRDRTQAVRQPITARRVIYGKVRVSGPITFLHSEWGNEFLNILYTLSGHPIEEIGAVYFDDELVTLDSGGNATGKYADHVVIQKGLGTTSGDASLLAWMIASAPGVWTSDHRQSGCGKLYVRLKYNASLFPNGVPNVSCIVKGKQLYDPRTGLTAWSDNAALCHRDYLTNATYGLGESSINDTSTIAAANVCDESVSTLNRVGNFSIYQVGTPTAALAARQNYVGGAIVNLPSGLYKYAITFLDSVGETLPGPETSYSAGSAHLFGVGLYNIPKGPDGTVSRRIYRTAKGGSQLKLLTTISDNTTTSYTDRTLDGSLGANAPLSSTTQVYDDIRVTDNKITLTTGSAVTLSTTGTLPTGLSAATWYVIDTGNNSYFLATSRANALAGTYVNITGVGSGTHTISSGAEVRYTCNGTIDTDTKPKDVIGSLLTSMMGTVAYQGGKWNIYAGAYRAPTVTLTEDDLDGPIKVTTRLSRSQTLNGVKGIFSNPLDFYQPTDFPAITNATYLSQDQGERIWKDIELSFTTSGSMAQRIAKIELEKARQQITTVWPCKLTAFRVQAGDVVNLTNTRFGWNAKPFEVAEWKFAIREDDSGAPRLGIDLMMRETASGVYDWNSGEETAVDLASNTSLPDPFTVQVPGNPAITEELYETTNSAGVKSKAIVTWGASEDSFVDTYQLEYRPATQEEFLVLTGIRGLSAELPDLAPGYYDFRVKAFNSIGIGSEYSNEVRTEIVGLSAPPTSVTGFSVIALGGNALASWALSPDLDVQINGSIIIRHTPKTSNAVWEDGVILETFPGKSVQGLVSLITGTYMAKAKDSTDNYSSTIASFVATEGMTTGFVTVATSTQAPGFTGAKTNVSLVGSVIRLTDPSVSLTGEYEFSSLIDMITIATRRLEADIAALIYVATDLIDSRGYVDSWASVDGGSVEGCDATLYVSTTNDDPAGSPVWTPWAPFMVADLTCRAMKFKLFLESDDPANNIDISVLTVHIKEAA